MIRALLLLLPPGTRGRVTGYAALTVVGVILRAVGVVVLVPVVAALFGPEPGNAWPWLGALTAITVAGWASDAWAVRIGYRLGFGLLDHAQHGVAERIARVRLSWFTAENTRTARTAIAATGPELVGLFAYLLTPLIGALLLPVAIGVALAPISGPLAVATLLGVPVLLGAFWASVRITRRADRRMAETNGRLTERILEFARTQQTLRAARRVGPARSHAGASVVAQHSATMRLIAMQIPGQLLFSLASQLALLLMAGTTTALTIRGALTVPEAIALIVVIARYLEPFATLGELSGAIETTQGTLGRIRAVLDAPLAATGTLPAYAGEEAPRIEFEDVAFHYGDGVPVLDGLDLVLGPGETTAVVGPSGAGKSTILALLAGLHEPTRGRILVDGVDLADLDADARRSLVSVVFQHPYLFAGTVRDNVLAGDPGAEQDRITEANALARVDELTDRLSDGDHTRVGEAGAELSGGERQRVSIARALLKPSRLLLVDEATSALDTENEAAVLRALTDDARPRTRIVIAHRLASIRTADRALFLDDGRIVEDGPVDELLARDGRFAEFWRRQDNAGAWQIRSDRPAAEPLNVEGGSGSVD